MKKENEKRLKEREEEEEIQNLEEELSPRGTKQKHKIRFLPFSFRESFAQMTEEISRISSSCSSSSTENAKSPKSPSENRSSSPSSPHIHFVQR